MDHIESTCGSILEGEVAGALKTAEPFLRLVWIGPDLRTKQAMPMACTVALVCSGRVFEPKREHHRCQRLTTTMDLRRPERDTVADGNRLINRSEARDHARCLNPSAING